MYKFGLCLGECPSARGKLSKLTDASYGENTSGLRSCTQSKKRGRGSSSYLSLDRLGSVWFSQTVLLTTPLANLMSWWVQFIARFGQRKASSSFCTLPTHHQATSQPACRPSNRSNRKTHREDKARASSSISQTVAARQYAAADG